ncbi:MAG: sugar transferase [Candidatus Saccharibacteria bacterium]|nr:sugar transferase [Candidatus Saccharibacteria bacterium]
MAYVRRRKKLLYMAIKRCFDIALAMVLLIIFAPLMAFLAIVIAIDSRGPILFRARRLGRHEKVFYMYKFRTFRADAPVIPPRSFINPHQFMTRSGKLLRRLSLDELPQIINVLRGDMSFIGPRPGSADDNEKDLANARRKLDVFAVRPGITGWAQVNGRDELAHDIVRKSQFDAYYIEHMGIKMDIVCLLRTLGVVSTGAGYQEGAAGESDDTAR